METNAPILLYIKDRCAGLSLLPNICGDWPVCLSGRRKNTSKRISFSAAEYYVPLRAHRKNAEEEQ